LDNFDFNFAHGVPKKQIMEKNDNNKELVNESLKQIHSLMNFKPGMTRTENKEIIEEQMGGVARRTARRAGRQAKRSTKDMNNVRSERKAINRKVNDIENIYDKLKNRTVNGEPALDVLRAKYKEVYGEDLPKLSGEPETAPTAQAKPAYVPKFPPCTGGVNKLGCKSNAVAQVQALVGGLDDKIKIDGMFGPRTKAAIEKVAPEYADQFTDADVAKIKQKVQSAGVKPKETEVTKTPEPRKINTSNFPSPPNALDNVKPDRLPTPKAVSEDDEDIPNEDMFDKPEIKPGGYKMTQGFVNESISQKERVRQNKQDRLNRKLGRI